MVAKISKDDEDPRFRHEDRAIARNFAGSVLISY
jgi:hypothetical protein